MKRTRERLGLTLDSLEERRLRSASTPGDMAPGGLMLRPAALVTPPSESSSEGIKGDPPPAGERSAMRTMAARGAWGVRMYDLASDSGSAAGEDGGMASGLMDMSHAMMLMPMPMTQQGNDASAATTHGSDHGAAQPQAASGGHDMSSHGGPAPHDQHTPAQGARSADPVAHHGLAGDPPTPMGPAPSDSTQGLGMPHDHDLGPDLEEQPDPGLDVDLTFFEQGGGRQPQSDAGRPGTDGPAQPAIPPPGPNLTGPVPAAPFDHDDRGRFACEDASPRASEASAAPEGQDGPPSPMVAAAGFVLALLAGRPLARRQGTRGSDLTRVEAPGSRADGSSSG